MRIYIILLLLATLASRDVGDCARILGLFPHTGKSHFMVFEPLLRELAKRGHHVTTVSYFPLKSPQANYTDVVLEGAVHDGLSSIDLSMLEMPNPLMKIPLLNTIVLNAVGMVMLSGFALETCERIVRQSSVIEALKQKYDVVIVEKFNSDCMLGLTHVFGIEAPIVGISSCAIMPWTYARFGLPNNPAYIPFSTTAYSSNMTFIQRLDTFISYLYMDNLFHNMIQKREQDIIEKHFGVKIPNLEELGKKQSSLLLVNTFHTLNGVRPTIPAVIEVGGMHLDHSRKELPPFIEKFLNESEHGVILMSFGSLMKTSSIPKYKEEIIVNALAKLKQRVIWKFEGSGEEGTLTGNILRVNWLPQYELLQHKKIVAFIAHGGLLGMTEAISAGKPMVVVPFFADQPANAAAAADAGFATVLPYTELTEERLTKAMEFVLSDESQLNARRVSSIWRDRPADPLETAVYWTERVIRWGHHAPLHSPARDMPFYQVALLDVIATLAVAILILLAMSWYILCKVFRLLFTKESKFKTHRDAGDCARILGLFPHIGKSHFMVFEPLLRALAERGQHVTTVSFFPLKNPPANYTDVVLEGDVLDDTNERAMIEKHFGVKIPDLEEISKKRTSVLLVNTFHTLNGVRPTLPAVIEVGGMHLDHSKKYCQHKKIVAFIAHGGLLGMTEAISAGKPMVVVPFFGDQPANAAVAVEAGFATILPFNELTAEALTKALEFVLSPKTQLNARRVSSIWRDRQADPLETAVYWTERVIRWGHHAPLHSPARDMPLYQVALLDVIATLAVAILILLAISWYILSKIFRLVFSSGRKLKTH
ncbi:PREDICTED: UDP-glucuronosyltransferase 2B37-like [Papilio polytes]|uniref:UDP-glucuronosyltransferase 2B37-like n=1 Tax=Papilio polytes TaxID=76194 RepID=UPI000675CAAF|nr:PREDICTED: UDP-glucuronosyltransferase 2B37-like [Papilio polytes]